MLGVAGRIISASVLLAFLVRLASCGCRSTWRGLQTQACLSDSLALWTRPSSSAPECVLEADKAAGLLVAQFDSGSRRCSLFRYIDMCHLIDGLKTAASEEHRTLTGCAAFANARAARFMALSSKLMLAVGPKLRAAWVMSDDAEASRSNLVCGQTQQWQSEAVEWTSQGAKFDGVSSKMWLENVEFADLQHGLTWLVRLKRNIRMATLLETYQRSNNQLGAGFWDGSPSALGLYFYRKSSVFSEFSTTPATNSFDPNEFVEVGVISSATATYPVFFSKSGFAPQSSVSILQNHTATTQLNFNSFRLGYRLGDSRMLYGFVQAVAIMNETLSETEINYFFSLVR